MNTGTHYNTGYTAFVISKMLLYYCWGVMLIIDLRVNTIGQYRLCLFEMPKLSLEQGVYIIIIKESHSHV